MGKVSGVGSLSVDPPHAAANPSSRPIASVLFLVPKRKKENGFLYMFIVLPFVFCLKGKDKKERKEENEHHLLFA